MPTHWDFTGLDPTVLRFDQTYAQRVDLQRAAPALRALDWRHLDGQQPAHAQPRGPLRRRARRLHRPRRDARPTSSSTTACYTTNVGYRNDLRDYNNVAPRVGFAWNVTGSGNSVIRGGTGLFYGHIGGNPSWDQQLWNGQRVIFNSYQNDGRPGFFADPTRGVTADDILSARVPLAPQSLSVLAHDIQTPYSWQTILGFQKRLERA